MRVAGILLLLTMIVGCSPIGPGTIARARFDTAAAVADPTAMTYRSSWLPSGQVTLVQGVYREPAAPGSAAELVVKLIDRQVFGTLDGQEVGAVVLVTQAGGTGSFYELALLTRETGGWVNSDLLLLGDRVDIHKLAIRDHHLVATMTTHGPQDPLCCPTLRVERRFAVQSGKLAAAGESTVAPVTAELVGTVWQWGQTLYNDDTRVVPPRSESYTVQFGANGTVNVRADCNRKGGGYTLDGQSLAIEITHSTMAACPDDSLEDRFVRDLTGGAGWFMKDGDLYIDLKYDSGTMRLKK